MRRGYLLRGPVSLLAGILLLSVSLASPSVGQKPASRKTWKEIRERANELKSDSRWQAMTPLERERWLFEIDASRRIAIEPKTPKAGINSGLVIAYGHVIKPPYEVEFRNEKFFVNGVQVRPSLIWEEEQKKRPKVEVTEEDRKRYSREEKIRRDAAAYFQKNRGRMAESELRAEINKIVSREPDVLGDASWEGESSVITKMRPSGILTRIDLKASPPPTPEERADFEKKQEAMRSDERAQFVEAIREELKKGGCIIFSSDGAMQHLSDVRPAVNKIMRTPNLSRKQRIERLKEEVFNLHSTAEDVADNYDSKDWDTE